MCDIYHAKCPACEEESEENGTDMHLSDFSTCRDEVVVFCGKHLEKAIECKNRTEFAWVGDDSVQHRAVVVALTQNAMDNWDGNHPNESADLPFKHYEDGKLVGEGLL